MHDLKKNQLEKIKNIIQNSSEEKLIKRLILELIDYEQFIGSSYHDLRNFKDDYKRLINKADKINNDN